MSANFAQSAVILIAHGSRRDEANNELHDLVGRLRAKLPDLWIEPAFLEIARPDIDAAANRCIAQGARTVLLVPYFLSMGVHLTRDLTDACVRLQAAHPDSKISLAPPLGPDELLDVLVLRRIQGGISNLAQSPLTPQA